MTRSRKRVPLWCAAFAVLGWFTSLAQGGSPAEGSSALPDAQSIVSKHTGVYSTPPDTVGTLDPSIKAYRIPDGPLMGNGDLAVAVGGTSTTQTFYFSKSDMGHSARGVGGLTFTFGAPAGDGAKYRQEQDLFRAEVRSMIPLRQAVVRMKSWTADSGNVLVTDLWTEDGAALEVSMTLWSHTDRSQAQAGAESGMLWATREITSKLGAAGETSSSKVAMAVRVMGAKPACSTDGKRSSAAKFSIPAGKKVTVVTAVAGGMGATNHIELAKAATAALSARQLDEMYAGHLAWWKQYWSKSTVSLGDELLERFYYGALYVLGCSSRAGSAPPGLAGPWHLNGPSCWSNKYTLDYNFMAVWWGVYACNRPEFATPYYDVILRLIPAGRQLAREHGTQGILFGVNAHAYGGFTDTRTLNMKGNASLAALNFMMHYDYTQDERFLVEKAWPLLKELAEFWEANLAWEAAGARWVVRDSGCREGQKDTNAINDLGHIRTLFGFLLSASATLEGKPSGGETIHITEARKEKWRGYVNSLSKFPTMSLDGKTVFKEAENRTKMSLGGAGDNSDVLMHVFPSEALGLGSDPELLQIARNTVAALNPPDKKASWFQANCFPKIYTQAVRSGYPAEQVVANLKRMLEGRQPYDDRGDHVRLRNNQTIVPPVHGLESVGAIEAINSMLLQSHNGTIRVFPAWLKDKDASFKDLRAVGAFLVSSAYKNGRVTFVEIKSEAGRSCRMANPWTGQTCEVVKVSGGQQEKINFKTEGGALSFSTEKGTQYYVRNR